MSQLDRIASPISSNWAIYEPYGRNMAATIQAFGPKVIEEHMASVRATVPREPREGEEMYDLLEGGVALIALEGPMMKRDGCMTWWFGGCATINVRSALRTAERDPKVRSIVLLVDSPGGEVGGTAQLADDVARVNQTKPVVAYVDDLCASAALWVASQAREIIAGSSAMIGSIGTYCVIDDLSKLYEARGVTVHVVSTGPHKGAFVDGAPVSQAHLEELQRNINSLNAEFVGAVARGRGLSLETVQKLADGRVHIGQEAVDLGLADSIGTLDQVVSSLQSWGASPYYSAALAAKETPNMPTIAQLTRTLLGLAPKAETEPTEPEVEETESEVVPKPAAETPEEAPAAEPVANAAILAQLQTLQAEKAQLQAVALANAAKSEVRKLVLEGKLLPAQQDAVEELYAQAMVADGSTIGAEGVPVEGPNLKAVRSAFAAAPAHKLFVSELEGSDPSKTSDSESAGATESKEVILARTAVGRIALEQKAKE